MKKVFTWILVACAAGISLVSCNKTDSVFHYTTDGYFTITGDMNTGYTLYRDFGGIVKPDMNDVQKVLGEKGFENEKRAMMSLVFTQDDVKDIEGGNVIENAKIVGGDFVDVVAPLSLSDADAKGVTATDSIFSVSRVSDVWCYRGYFNTAIYGAVSINKEGKYIRPSINLVYDPASMEDNKLELMLYYNRHSSQESSTGLTTEFIRSYDISNLLSLVPGQDSIMVTLRMKGADATSCKIGRKDFLQQDYLPYKLSQTDTK